MQESTTLLEQKNQEHISLLKDRVSALKTVPTGAPFDRIAGRGYWQRGEKPKPLFGRDGAFSPLSSRNRITQ